ncbi:MAG: hypothetical protein KGS72_21345 [Cyanobacteria bacterium REEB67]|nr:hypothetical protein [Cyanobacteria bacterium REEB67]
MAENQTPAEQFTRKKAALLAALLISAVAIYFLADGPNFDFVHWRRKYRQFEIAKPRVKPIKVTGEVVDAWCYASQTMGPGRGEGHKACALACSYGGVTMGILEDGSKDLYIAAKTKGYHGCNELLIPYVAQKVTVTGWVGDLGGCRMLKIDKVEAVPIKSSFPTKAPPDHPEEVQPPK